MKKEDFTNSDSILNRKRESETSFRFFIIAIGFFLVCTSLIGFLYVLIYSNFFKVKNIELSGNKFAPQEKIILALIYRNLSKGFWWFGLLGPDNILFWNSAKGDNKLDNSANVASVNVNIDFWQRKVNLQVTERKLFGIWCIGSECYGFDENGIAFTKAPSVEGALYLRIDDSNSRPLFLGKSVLPNSQWFNNLITTINIIKDYPLTPVQIAISNLDLREWKAEISNGAYFYFNLEFVPDNLSNILKNLSAKVDFNQLIYLDFRVPNRIYYK